MGDRTETAQPARPIMLVFDGDCGFCSRYASWVAGRLPRDVNVVPWQELEDLNDYGLTRQNVDCAAWWIDDERRWAGADAIARSLMAAQGLWARLGRLMLVWPVSVLSRVAYRWIAKNRHRLPGATAACKTEESMGA